MKLLNTAIVLLLFLLSCQKECPENVYLEGIIPLMPKSITAHPYAGKIRAVFINETNDTLKYAVNGFDTLRVIEQQLGEICSTPDTKASLRSKVQTTGGTFSFIGTPGTSRVQSFHLSISPRNLNSADPLDTVMVDAMLLFSHLYTETPSPGLSTPNNRLELISCPRGNAGSDLLSAVEVAYFETITLGNREFEKVYTSTNNFREIYYSFEKGIVAFADQADFWFLSHLE